MRGIANKIWKGNINFLRKDFVLLTHELKNERTL